MLGLVEKNEETAEAQVVTTTGGRRRRRKSIVWEHFTIETVSAGCRRACCKQCKQSFAYSTGSKVAGTSHLKRHLTRGSCQINHDPSSTQLTPYSPRRLRRHHRSLSSPPAPFDPDPARQELARYLITEDRPLDTVQRPAFLSLLHSLQPGFRVPDLASAQNDCLSVYLREKQAVLALLSSLPGRRLSLSLRLLSSPHSVPYAFVSAHFLDPEWRPARRLLNAVPSADPTRSFSLSLSDWSLQGRLFSVTLSRRPAPGEDALLRRLLSLNDPGLLGGQLLLSDCLASALADTALQVLLDSRTHTVVDKVRKRVAAAGPGYVGPDDRRRWDTTLRMMEAACEAKEAFSSTGEGEDEAAVTVEDWRTAEAACSRLRLLHETARLLHNPAVTPNLLFHEAWKLKTELGGFSERIARYWEASHLVLAAAVAMDPRFKMKLVEFSFAKIYGDGAAERVRIVAEGIRDLFAEYAGDGPGAGEPAAGAEGGRFSDFEEYVLETSRHNARSEVEIYMEEQLLPRGAEVDVMGWWRVNGPRYPTLARVAADLMSVAVSTVPPGEVFEAGRAGEVDGERSSLGPEMVQALLCCKDWLPHVSTPIHNAIVKLDYSGAIME